MLLLILLKKVSAIDGLSLNQVVFLHFLNRAGHSFVSYFCQRKAVPLNPSRFICRNRAEFAPRIWFKLLTGLPLPLTRTESVPRKKINYGVWSLWPYHWVRPDWICQWWWVFGQHHGSHWRLIHVGIKSCTSAQGATKWALLTAKMWGRGTSPATGQQLQRSLRERNTRGKSFSTHSHFGVCQEAKS